MKKTNVTEKRKTAFNKIIKALGEYNEYPCKNVEFFPGRLVREEIYEKLSREQIRTAALAFALVANIPNSQAMCGPELDHDLSGLLEDYLLDSRKRKQINRLRRVW